MDGMTREEIMEAFLQALDEGNEEHAEHWQAMLDEIDRLDDQVFQARLTAIHSVLN